MQSKFLYSYNAFKSWLGGLGWVSRGSRRVDLAQTQAGFQGLPRTKFIWRNKGDDQYLISEAFEDNPLQLSNYLLIRTREHIYLLNKKEQRLKQGSSVSGKIYDSVKGNYFEQALQDVHVDLEAKLKQLQRLFRIKNDEYSMPVAFATNALYILARNGMIESNDRVVAEKLIPLLHEKKDYLHGEGLAQAVYALEQAQNYDQATWALLKEKIEDKDFDYIVVKNDHWNVLEFMTHSGSEHLMQEHNDEFTHDLFFQDKLNLFELYNSVKAVCEAAPHLQLESTVESLERKYPHIVIEQNEQYLALSQEKFVPKFLLQSSQDGPDGGRNFRVEAETSQSTSTTKKEQALTESKSEESK